jgi:hypothetical protein
MLKVFGIVPNTIQLPDGSQPNGYKRSQFEDAFNRYLSQPPGSPAPGSPSSPTPTNPEASGESQSSPRGLTGEELKRLQSLEKHGLGELGEPSSPLSARFEDNGDSIDLPDDFYAQLMVRGRRPGLN